MPETLRITKGTFDTETFAPDGSHRFPEGLIVAVGEGAGQVPALTARRWRRAGFAEDYEGDPGSRVTNEDAGMTAAAAAAEIQRFQAIHAQAVQRESGRTGAANTARATVLARDQVTGVPGARLGAEDHRTGLLGATDSPGLSIAEADRVRLEREQAQAASAEQVPAAESTRPAGDAPYRDPDAEDPWDAYDLTDQQRESLASAGFRTPEQVRDADPGDLLGLRGIGPATVAKLRGGED